MSDRKDASAAVKAYHSVTGLKLKAPLAAGVDQAVGKDDVHRWHQVVLAWVACGWNPKNVKGMLQHYRDGKIPGDDMGQRGQSVAYTGDIKHWRDVADGPFGETVWQGTYAEWLAERGAA